MRWDRLVKAVAERLGTKADSVFDLPRMLRVPGSYNCKGSNEGSRSDTRGAADAQHIRGAGPETVGSRSMDTSASDRPERSILGDAGDGFRSRTALMSGPTVLAGGHDGGYHTSAPRVSQDTGLEFASTAPGPDGRRGAGRRTLSGRLRRQLAAVTHYFGARSLARSSSARCRAVLIRRHRPSGSGGATPPEGGSAAPCTGTG